MAKAEKLLIHVLFTGRDGQFWRRPVLSSQFFYSSETDRRVLLGRSIEMHAASLPRLGYFSLHLCSATTAFLDCAMGETGQLASCLPPSIPWGSEVFRQYWEAWYRGPSSGIWSGGYSSPTHRAFAHNFIHLASTFKSPQHLSSQTQGSSGEEVRRPGWSPVVTSFYLASVGCLLITT